jgi:hypothetical protein
MGVAAMKDACTGCAAPVGKLAGACLSFAARGSEGTGGAPGTIAAAKGGRRKGYRERGSSNNRSNDGAMALNEIILAKTAPKSWSRGRDMFRCTWGGYRRTARGGNGRVSSNGYESAIAAISRHCRRSISRRRLSPDAGTQLTSTHTTRARVQVGLG